MELDIPALASAYLRDRSGQESEKAGHELSPWEVVEQLVRHEPERAWQVILELVRQAEDDMALAYIAAGPIENLICFYPAEFMDRFVVEARRNSKFGRAVRCV